VHQGGRQNGRDPHHPDVRAREVPGRSIGQVSGIGAASRYDCPCRLGFEAGYKPAMGSALIIIDMLNPYEHEDAQPLMDSVRAILPALQDLIALAVDREIPIVYVNDNYGDWSAGRPEIIERALAGADPTLVEPVLPPEGTLFLVKARHSIFYQSPLEYLLGQFDADRLILAGQVTEQCVLYSALDAYVRHFQVAVLPDAVAHIHQDLAEAALRMMKTNMRAQIATTSHEVLQSS
jgi:nicotinamidase-related amidase